MFIVKELNQNLSLTKMAVALTVILQSLVDSVDVCHICEF